MQNVNLSKISNNYDQKINEGSELTLVREGDLSYSLRCIRMMDNFTIFENNNDVLLLYYDITAPVYILLNLLGIYLIVFKSSREMGEYRWYLLFYQIWVLAMDIFMNILCKPVLYIPILAGRGYGFLITKLGISPFACAVSSRFIHFFLFFYRHQCVIKKNPKLNGKIFIYLTILFSFAFICSHIIFLHLCNVDPSQLLIKLTSVLIILGLICHIQYIFWKQCEHLTVHTQEQQKKFLRAQIIQTTFYFYFYSYLRSYLINEKYRFSWKKTCRREMWILSCNADTCCIFNSLNFISLTNFPCSSVSYHIFILFSCLTNIFRFNNKVK
uniref:G_PROTEIN_RECEP_F1_2 domain-containing protein n=1 Tax=Heterorhabditis bacteriophora TaxID=37862 RepID=A0A1I7WWY4_HETBA